MGVVRSFSVSVGDQLSGAGLVTSGVPQGSVLGPALFLYFINGVLSTIPENVGKKLFADDLKIWCNASDSSNLQVAINAVYSWSESWLLPINLSKCSVLHLGSSNLCHRTQLEVAHWRHLNALEISASS